MQTPFAAFPSESNAAGVIELSLSLIGILSAWVALQVAMLSPASLPRNEGYSDLSPTASCYNQSAIIYWRYTIDAKHES